MREDTFNRLFESVLDDLDAVEQGSSARKLADVTAIRPEDMFNQTGNKRYRIACPWRTEKGYYDDVRPQIVRLYENFLEILMHQHFTRDFVARVVFRYNNGESYAAYCETPEEFEKTTVAIGCELRGDRYTNVHISFNCDFNPVESCARNTFLRDWILIKRGMYYPITHMQAGRAYAATASMTNKIDIDMSEKKVPPYLPIIDFYCWLFGEKGGRQKTELEYKKKFKRICGHQLSILRILDWYDEHLDMFSDWQLEVVGYISPSSASSQWQWIVRLYDKPGFRPTFDDVFDFVDRYILGRMSLEDIRSIFGEGAIPSQQNTLIIYVELPFEEIWETHAAGMKKSGFYRELSVRGE